MPGAYSNILQPSPKNPTVSFGGGSYLGVGVPSKATSSGREKRQVWIHIQKTREYLERGYQVSPLLCSAVAEKVP